ncbi:MAG: hypothetical protein WCE64_11660 [Bacteroidales bacterium]
MKKLVLMMVMLMAAVIINAQTQRTSIEVSALPAAIPAFITKDYSGFAIKSAVKIVKDNKTEYEAVISKGTTQDNLLFDSNGNFIKKLMAKEGTMSGKSTWSSKHMAQTKTAKKPAGK